MGDLIQQEQWNTLRSGWNRDGGRKPAISLKRCKIGPWLLWQTNRKLHTRFWLTVKISMTLDDLEWLKRTLAEKMRFTKPTAHQKNLNEDRPILSRVTTCLENLEMSGNLKHVGEMPGIMLTVRELSGKNYCQGKLARLGGSNEKIFYAR